MESEKTTLNQEIEDQFDKLNFLIEQQLKKDKNNDFGEDKLAEAISEEWGDKLKNSTCYDILDWAATLSKTESEQAIYSLEDAFSILRDEEVEKLTKLYRNALKVTDYWFDKDLSSERKLYFFDIFMPRLRSAAETVYDEIDILWRFRSKHYRSEIEELKNKLNEVS